MDEYGDMLLRTAYLLLRDRQSAEEAVQDTFIQAYAKISQLQEPGRIRPTALSAGIWPPSWLPESRCLLYWSWPNVILSTATARAATAGRC